MAIGPRGGHCVGAVRLERTRDGEHHSYIIVVRHAVIGSSEEDAIFLPASPGHARIVVDEGALSLTVDHEDASASVAGQRVRPGTPVRFTSGEVLLGGVLVRVAPAVDDDMKP